MPEQIFDSLNILGIPLSVTTSYPDTVAKILGRIWHRRKTFCVAINPEKVYRAQTDREERELLHQADLHICDGVGTAIAARLLHNRKIVRITGIQLFLDLVAAAEEHDLGVFLLGASPESNAGACRELHNRHPRLRIVGNQDGYFKSDRDVLEKINASGADMVFVAMGSPRQEKWIAEHLHEVDAPYLMGVGGSIDVVSGNVPWAPPVWRKTGTEFVYRVLREPWRWRRTICKVQFGMRVLHHALLGPATGTGAPET
jgi:N-acetylglucosaminyldiphosphoundecaprenol N-acetyl-beta-D-mannosaminyltransferase